MFMVLSSRVSGIARVHPFHAMNAEQHQTAADCLTKPTDLSSRPACRLLGNHIHHCHLLSLSILSDSNLYIRLSSYQHVGYDGTIRMAVSTALLH